MKLPRLRFLFPATCLILVCFSSLSGLAASKPQEVTIYLHNGTDVTGVLTGLNAENYEIQTDKGTEKIGRKRYQGMVLNTSEEKALSEKISRDAGLYITSAKYAYDLRGRIQANFKEPKKVCTFKNYPLAHFQVKRNGKIQNLGLLVRSGCPELDNALLSAIQNAALLPLPADYTLPVFPVNFPYQPPQKAVAKPGKSAAP